MADITANVPLVKALPVKKKVRPALSTPSLTQPRSSGQMSRSELQSASLKCACPDDVVRL